MLVTQQLGPEHWVTMYPGVNQCLLIDLKHMSSLLNASTYLYVCFSLLLFFKLSFQRDIFIEGEEEGTMEVEKNFFLQVIKYISLGPEASIYLSCSTLF